LCSRKLSICAKSQRSAISRDLAPYQPTVCCLVWDGVEFGPIFAQTIEITVLFKRRSQIMSLASLAVDTFVVAGVAWPYIPQARAMLAARSPAGFSLFASLIILVSATLRCFYYLVRPFDTSLLLQAGLSIATQLAMVAVVTSLPPVPKPSLTIVPKPPSSPGGGAGTRGGPTLLTAPVSAFWAWSDWLSYAQCMAAFTAVVAVVHWAFAHTVAYEHMIGAAALGIEAMLPVPQVRGRISALHHASTTAPWLFVFGHAHGCCPFPPPPPLQAIRNWTTKSTVGLSTVLIVSWAAGDAFKTVFALARAAPLPFVACGVFQLAVDIVLLLQLWVRAFAAHTGTTSAQSHMALPTDSTEGAHVLTDSVSAQGVEPVAAVLSATSDPSPTSLGPRTHTRRHGGGGGSSQAGQRTGRRAAILWQLPGPGGRSDGHQPAQRSHHYCCCCCR